MSDFKFSIKCIDINTENWVEKEMMFSDVDGFDDLDEEKNKLFEDLKETDPTLTKKSCKFEIKCI